MAFEINGATAIFLSFLFLIIFIFLFALFQAWKTRRLRKNYREEDDASRKGEQRRLEEQIRGIREKQRIVDNRKSASEGFGESEGHKLLPATETDADGKDGNSTGKTGKSSRGFFKLLRRRKE